MTPNNLFSSSSIVPKSLSPGLIITSILLAGLLKLLMMAMATSHQHPMHAVPKMPKLPSGVVKYSQLPKTGAFVKDTIPKGLLRQHNTKAGTWGVIKVQKGSLQYQINEPRTMTFKLEAPAQATIEPTVFHEVKPLSDDVEFAVEFYRMPGTGPVEEKRE